MVGLGVEVLLVGDLVVVSGFDFGGVVMLIGLGCCVCFCGDCL